MTARASTTAGSSATASVPARVHLAGNPSDGYGGAVLSATVATLAATVRIEPGTGTDAPDEVVGHPDGEPLVRAALDALAALVPTARRRPGTYRWSTTIPRSVGLGGSSAIVLATMRAALDWWEVDTVPDDLDLATAALEAEVVRLGMAAGIADRTVQAVGGVVLTDCGTDSPRVSTVGPASEVALTVLVDESAQAPSGDYHRTLRARHEAGDPALAAAVADLARLADDGARALATGDVGALGVAMDDSLTIRRSLGDVPAAALRHVDALRAQGAAVNFAGSGGALVVLGRCPTPAGTRRLEVVLGGGGRSA